jgi:hypothetical protein
LARSARGIAAAEILAGVSVDTGRGRSTASIQNTRLAPCKLLQLSVFVISALPKRPLRNPTQGGQDSDGRRTAIR